jgi:hypothetical protein
MLSTLCQYGRRYAGDGTDKRQRGHCEQVRDPEPILFIHVFSQQQNERYHEQIPDRACGHN